MKMAITGLSALFWFGLVSGLMSGFQPCLAISASFYGASYVSLPVNEVSSETEIHLRFRTSRTRGLLLLAAGDTDYCIIELRSGKVQVWMDLGAGIIGIESTKGLKLNDLQWHTVDLHRINENVNLTIDEVHTVSVVASGEFFELNIEEGVYIGGPGNLKKDYIGESEKYFRGCISDVTFNSVDLYQTAEDLMENDFLKQYAEIEGVTWNCSAEFDASPNDAVSFTEGSSYLSYAKWEAEEKGSFSCWLKTHAEIGLLLYSGGEGEDYAAVEIVEGKIHMLINKGIGPISLQSDIKINDRKWHWIMLRIEESFLEISVDRKPQILTLEDGEGQVLELSGPLFVGGVLQRIRNIASRLDLASLTGEQDDVSFQGCMRDIEINGVGFSIPDARATNLIKPGCVWEYPCSREPCIPEAECLESGWSEYECKCNIEVCEKPIEDIAIIEETNISEITEEKKDKKKKGKDSGKSKKFLVLGTLEVEEGGEAVITSDQIEVNVDLDELGLRESQVVFRVVRKPRFGELIHDVLRRDNNDVFTLLDVIGGRIIYSHDGTENFIDRMTFEVDILGNDGELPTALQEDNNFVLRIEIQAVNDIPEFIMPPGNLFQLVLNTKRMISTDILNANDPDNDVDEVQYSTLSDISAMGYIENVDNPGQSINTFTQQDINMGKIFFVHDGTETKSRLGLRVSDLEGRSDPVSLRMEAVELTLTVSRNSGIRVNPSSTVIIKPEQLSVETNSPEQDLAIQYEVLTSPKYGEIQRMYSDHWRSITEFSQRQLEKDKIRFAPLYDSEHLKDSFQLQATCMDVSTDPFEVMIDVIAVHIKVANNTPLLMDIIKEKTLTQQHLGSVVVNAVQNNFTITYSITKLPEHGNLVRHSVRHLELHDQFTQDDINKGHIGFRIKHHIRKHVNDTFEFHVSTTGYQSSIFTFHVMYIPDKLSTTVVNTGIEVKEGTNKVISSEDLSITHPLADDFRYTVMTSPQHGSLRLINPVTQEVVEMGITAFSNNDIVSGRLVYHHDNSESVKDAFQFTAMAISNEPELDDPKDTTVVETFNITVQLVNDNKPHRVIDKVFKVVMNSEKALTGNDLKYADGDIDFPDNRLQYSRQMIPNGQLVNVNNVSLPVYHFTQADLDTGKLLFKHSGAPFGRMVFYVYDQDRAKYSSGLLVIEASDPYIRVVDNTGLIVQKGRGVIIMPANLTVETNLNARDKSIEFYITEPPKHGMLSKKGEDGNVVSFNLEALKNGRIRYQHDDSDILEDGFNFTVKVKDVETTGYVSIRIYLKSHQSPPDVAQLRPLVVKEGSVGTIKKANLRVVHKDSIPNDIVFHIRMQPKHGFLRLLTAESVRKLNIDEDIEGLTSEEVETTTIMEDEADYLADVEVETEFITTFTQTQIDQGRVQYVEMEPGQAADRFIFDVTNGILTVPDQVFKIDIIPDVIPLRVRNIEVREGSSRALTEKYIKVTSKYMKDQVINFIITSEPMRGRIENSRAPGIPLMQFTSEDVLDEFIYYVHDDSDTLTDQFSFIANSTSTKKLSSVHSINVTVSPVNDEPPDIVINNGMEVFIGAVTIVTTEDMSAEDKDTEDSQIVFSLLTPPTNGFMAKKLNTNKAITNFTQDDIVNHRIVFVHNGARTGGFRFQVNDGQHSAKRQIFSITAKPLVLSIGANLGIDVYPDSVQPITPQHLKITTNEEPEKTSNKSIIFRVDLKPELGELVRIPHPDSVPDTYHALHEFTQDDINKGKVGYKHEQTSSKWTERDRFVFDVFHPLAQNITGQLFLITISYENIGGSIRSPLLANTGVEVTEGNAVIITSKQLDASNLYAKVDGQSDNYIIEYNITKLPTHGILVVNGNNVTEPFIIFIQDDLAKKRVHYLHDHSDTLQDSFGFNVALGRKDSLSTDADKIQAADDAYSDVANLGDTFNITIVPVNDQLFSVVTSAPGMDVVQGFNKVITKKHLETIDPDTGPDGILYAIIRGPSNGRIALTRNHSVDVHEFTQEQINNGDLIFIHNGAKEHGSFSFSVSDGVHKKQYKLFKLNITPLSLILINNTGVELLQGDLYAPITRNQLGAGTNGNRNGIMYNITSQPRFGMLLVNEQPQTTFSQIDIDEEQLAYIQTDRSASEDEFQFVVYNSKNILAANVFKVTAKAIIKKSHISVRAGSSSTITVAELDATELANRTLSNPNYNIVEFPQHCQILNSSTSQSISHFSHNDIISKKVIISADPIEMGNSTKHVADLLVLSLHAKNVQPALVDVPIVLKPIKTKKTMASEESSPTTGTIGVLHPNIVSDLHPDPDDTEEDTNEINIMADGGRNPTKNPDGSGSVGNNSLANNEPGSSLVNQEPVSGGQLAVIIPIIVLLVLATVVVIVIIWRMRRRDKPKNDDSPYPEPDEGPLPVVHPQRVALQGSPGQSSASTGFSSMPPPMPPAISPVLSPGMPERSPMVPQVTVTPLGKPTGMEDPRFALNYPAMPAGPSGQSVISLTSSGSGTMVYNWQNTDPEMQEHCRSTNPSLKKNQYWV